MQNGGVSLVRVLVVIPTKTPRLLVFKMVPTSHMCCEN